MKILLVAFTFLFGNFCLAQTLEKVIVSEQDPYYFYISDGDSTSTYYYKIIPKEKPIGVLTLFPSGGETIENLLKQITLHKRAYENNLLVIIPSFNWGTIQRVPDIAFLDTIFKQVVTEHKVPKDKFVLCGLSNGGMISLTYGIHAVRDSSTFLTPRGIIGLDPFLDFSRFYKYCEREIERDFNEGGVAEAKWFFNTYNKVYGGSPDEFPQNYIEASIFSYGEEGGGNARFLNNIAIRMHSDLNLDFLLNQQHRDLYDWNGIDIVAFVNQLKINGNDNASAIITQNKGVRLDGSKHPHSWSIMDTDNTMNWILALLEE